MRLIDADLFIQRIESYNTLDEMDKALYNFALHEIVCMPTVDVLDKIRDEIENLNCEYINYDTGCSAYISQNEVLQILNKYIKE